MTISWHLKTTDYGLRTTNYELFPTDKRPLPLLVSNFKKPSITYPAKGATSNDRFNEPYTCRG